MADPATETSLFTQGESIDSEDFWDRIAQGKVDPAGSSQNRQLPALSAFEEAAAAIRRNNRPRPPRRLAQPPALDPGTDHLPVVATGSIAPLLAPPEAPAAEPEPPPAEPPAAYAAVLERGIDYPPARGSHLRYAVAIPILFAAMAVSGIALRALSPERTALASAPAELPAADGPKLITDRVPASDDPGPVASIAPPPAATPAPAVPAGGAAVEADVSAPVAEEVLRPEVALGDAGATGAPEIHIVRIAPKVMPEPAADAAPPAAAAAESPPAESAPPAAATDESDSVTVRTAVNMRSSPTRRGRTIQVVPEGAEVDLIQCRSWCEVTYEGRRGWVYKRFLDPDDLPST